MQGKGLSRSAVGPRGSADFLRGARGSHVGRYGRASQARTKVCEPITANLPAAQERQLWAPPRMAALSRSEAQSGRGRHGYTDPHKPHGTHTEIAPTHTRTTHTQHGMVFGRRASPTSPFRAR